MSSATQDWTVRLWDVAQGKELRVLSGHTYVVSSVAFSPDGRLLASGGHDNTVRLWTVATGDLVRVQKGHDLAVTSVSFRADGQVLASTGLDGRILLWDPRDGSTQQQIALDRSHAYPRQLVFSPDNRHLAVAGGNGTISIFRLSARPAQVSR
jgi:WD40 repeat protein